MERRTDIRKIEASWGRESPNPFALSSRDSEPFIPPHTLSPLGLPSGQRHLPIAAAQPDAGAAVVSGVKELDTRILEGFLQLPVMDIDEFGGDPERVAGLVRRTWLVPTGPLKDLVGWVERAGCLVVHCDFAALSVDGVTIKAPGLPPPAYS